MTTVSAVATKVRIATAASAIVAAATLVPAAVAYASPAAPLPQAGLGSTLAGGTVAPCDPAVDDCVPGVESIFPGLGDIIGDSNGTPIIATPAVWLGSPANPDFQPLFGIVFPNTSGLSWESCVFGAAVHLSAYPKEHPQGFIGIGYGC
jgi:hypothetical protein